MTACNYIDTLYQEILNSYLGIPIDYEVLDMAITSEVITLAIDPILDNTYTTNCTLQVLRDACNINITIL